MSKEVFLPHAISVPDFSARCGSIQGEWNRSSQNATQAQGAHPAWPRILEDCEAWGGVESAKWDLFGEARPDASGGSVAWLHVSAQMQLWLQCQRCLEPVLVSLSVDRWFRFVSSEEQAQLEDDSSEEDVLVTSTQFDWQGLLEDEWLMLMPLVPMHDQCEVFKGDWSSVVAERMTEAGDVQQPFSGLKKLWDSK